MHVDAIGKYEGPPCKMCTDRQFVGVCTHRPISQAYRDKISKRMEEVWKERREQIMKALQKPIPELGDLDRYAIPEEAVEGFRQLAAKENEERKKRESGIKRTEERMTTLKTIQDKLPWGIEYGELFKASKIPYKDFQHALLHVSKASGKLAAIVEDADHDRGFAGILDISKLLADLVICACRMASTVPGAKIDLELEVLLRIKEKNGVSIG